jgi:two-component system, cell cycle sensor histidine kinase and response regulator CckA
MSATNPIPWPVASRPFPCEESATESLFRSFFDKAPIAAACCDSEGRITKMNRAFEHSLGVGAGDRKCLRLRDLVCPKDRGMVDCLIADLMESRCDFLHLSLPRGSQEGETRNCVAWRPVSPGGKSASVVIVAETESTGEGNAEILFEAQRWETIGRLTGGVVHDFNNLLTGVMLYCDLLLSAVDQRDLQKRYAEEIRAAIAPASGLVRQLLAFARPQDGASNPTSFNEIAEGMREVLTRLVGENIRLELRLDSQLGAVKMPRSQAQQVLLNLVLNARDAMPEGGCICIETGNGSFQPIAGGSSKISNACLPCVLLRVTDNGHGMDGETRRRLFEPFFTTKAGKAGGLGLTTVRSIVASHHGLIHFESEPGIGTRAMILLPRADEWLDRDHLEVPKTSLQITSAIPLQDAKKESLL